MNRTGCRRLVPALLVMLTGLLAAPALAVEFGDNGSQWHGDGTCDDPRFSGAGMSRQPSGADLGHDADDCRMLYRTGDVDLTGPAVLNAHVDAAGVDFGDDNSEFPNDGECDDPRFEGPGMAFAGYLDAADTGHDASDCSMHFITGQVWLISEKAGAVLASEIEFGDDSSRWSGNGECDDPRFEGPGMAVATIADDRNHDATDCRTLFDAGQVTLAGDGEPVADLSFDGVNFGDDESTYPRDGECDDPRFTGEGMAPSDTLSDAGIGHDSSDCLSLYQDGKLSLIENDSPAAGNTGGMVDFGDDDGEWPNDNECDDPRFTGPGMAYEGTLDAADQGHDASDCRYLYNTGQISLPRR